jgi:phosphatidate phosphatase APP1
MYNKRSSFDRLQTNQRARERSRWHAVQDDVVLYFAFGSCGHVIVEGRVIDFQRERLATASDRSLTNLRRSLRLIFNEERRHREVRLWMTSREWHTVTDDEGYFRCELKNLAAVEPGWHRIHADCGDATDSIGLLLVPPENVHGLISDIDDTVLVSEVSSKRRLLLNTFLRNPLQRAVVSGVAQLYRTAAERNPLPSCAPLFYLSASPRQLHLPLQTILDHNGLPPGVLITKRVTNDATSEPLRNQFAYKKRKLEEILGLVKHVRFTLVGDDSEHDPEVFAEIRRLYPERIDAIWMRHVHPDTKRARLENQLSLAELLQAHTTIEQDAL